MDSSPTSERRAQMIRDMAHDLNRTRQSLGSNSDFADLTGSQLSVDDESSEAYRLEHHNGPKRSSRFASRLSQDFVIDTSAIGRAFPDMTGSGSSIDDASSISIEVGRGNKRTTRNLSDDGTRDSLGLEGRYKVDLSKLPRRTFSSGRPLQDVSTNMESLRSSPPPLKSTRYETSGSSQQGSIEARRSAPPKVTIEDAEDHTGSTASRDSQNNTMRSTRFAKAQLRDTLALPKRFTSGENLLHSVNEKPPRANTAKGIAKGPVENPTVTSTNGGTFQSFMLPNVPNMSELVSGVYDDGTPVFSRKSGGRFTPRKSPAVKYSAVPSIPVPQDEEAIVLSLQLLQEKVARLEKHKAEAQVVVNELQNINRGLENEKKEWKRTSRKHDNAMGSSAGSDAADEGQAQGRKLIMDRERLQINVRNLQNELDGANRRAAVAEANLTNVTQERDAAVSQLGIAFISQEELKVDNDTLKEENKKLVLEAKKYRAAIDGYIQRAEDDKTDKLERADAIKSRATDEEGTRRNSGSMDCQVLDVDTPGRPKSRRNMTKADTTEHESMLNMPKRQKRRIVLEEFTATSDFAGFTDAEIKNIGERIKDASRNLSRNVTSHIAQKERAHSRRRLAEDELKDATQASRVSFLQNGDVTILRKMLEREHLIKKGRLQPAANPKPLDDLPADVTQLTNHTSRSRALPRKSSLKDLTGQSSNKGEMAIDDDYDDGDDGEREDEPTHHSRARSQARRHSDLAVGTRNARNGRVPSVEDMTSAFIIPDITMHPRQRRASQANADMTNASSAVVPDIIVEPTTHEPGNCTVCTRIAGNCSYCNAEHYTEVDIPKPIPVSDRIDDLALDGEDHTTRPSEAPAEALARTIKALEDEFAHMGLQIAELQNIYNDLDPSLQKRKRKALGDRIDKLRAAMDAKADQVYALYDVLEGQKKSGKLDSMTENELNDTLTSVLGHNANLGNLGMPNGIMFKRGQKTSKADVTPAKERPQPRRTSTDEREKKMTATPAAQTSKFPWDESYDDVDGESLPWEGFDDTMDLTGGSRKSNTSSRRRRSIGL